MAERSDMTLAGAMRRLLTPLAALLLVTALIAAIGVAIGMRERSAAYLEHQPDKSLAARLHLHVAASQSAFRGYALTRSESLHDEYLTYRWQVESDTDQINTRSMRMDADTAALTTSQTAAVKFWRDETIRVDSLLHAGDDVSTMVSSSRYEAVRIATERLEEALQQQIEDHTSRANQYLLATAIILALLSLIAGLFVWLGLSRLRRTLLEPIIELRDVIGWQSGGRRGDRVHSDTPIRELRQLGTTYNRWADLADQAENAHNRTHTLLRADLELRGSLLKVTDERDGFALALRHAGHVLNPPRGAAFHYRDGVWTWAATWSDGEFIVNQPIDTDGLNAIGRMTDRFRATGIGVAVLDPTDPGDRARLPFVNQLSALGLRSILVAPVWFGDETFGLLCLAHVDTPHTWDEEERAALRRIADQLAYVRATGRWQRKPAAPPPDDVGL